MNCFVLEYKFHLYTIDFLEKEIENRKIFYEKLEDCLSDYRQKKDALFANIFNYNTDFKIYRCILEEIPIEQINMLM